MLTLKEIKPDDPDYYKPLDELIEDLGHAEPAKQYGDVIITVEDLTDALHYLKEYRKRLIQDLDELRQKKYELETNMKLDAILQLKPWEKRK